MKRPILVLLLAVLIVGTLSAYSRFLAGLSRREVIDLPPAAVAHGISLTVTFTADLEADAFALDDTASLVVRFEDRVLLRREGKIAASEMITIPVTDGVRAGNRSLWVRAIPALTAANRANALRLRAYQGESLLAEKSLWCQPGEVMEGELSMVIPSATRTPAP